MKWEKTSLHIQTVIGYEFSDKKWLYAALTHSSYANEHKKDGIKYNERLEFLGDSVLGLAISEYLFSDLYQLPEGELTKLRAVIVCESALSQVAGVIGLGKYMRLGKGEDMTGGRKRRSILADAMEALIGAIYMDGGFVSAKTFVLSQFTPLIKEAKAGKRFMDYKTELQETMQKDGACIIEYKVIHEMGPDHLKTFDVEVFKEGISIGVGRGRNKKEAEQNAALDALNGIRDEA